MRLFQVAHLGHITKNRQRLEQRWQEAEDAKVKKEMAEAKPSLQAAESVGKEESFDN